jgi:hypothetical protein
MRFLLRKDYYDPRRHRSPDFVVVPRVLIGAAADPRLVIYDPDRRRASRFPDQHEAERWQAALHDAEGLVVLIAVED